MRPASSPFERASFATFSAARRSPEVTRITVNALRPFGQPGTPRSRAGGSRSSCFEPPTAAGASGVGAVAVAVSPAVAPLSPPPPSPLVSSEIAKPNRPEPTTSSTSTATSAAAGARASQSASERIFDQSEDPLAAALHREGGEDALARAACRAGAELERAPDPAGHLGGL